MKKSFLAALSISTLMLPFSFSCNNNNSPCTVIKNNYRNYVLEHTNTKAYEEKTIADIKNELVSETIGGVETYKFNDIDYTFDWDRAKWPAASHLSRAVQIALVAEKQNNQDLKDIAKKLTYHWIFSNYHNINWWQNELGANSNLANLGLFTFDYLGKKGQDAFNGKIRESSLKYRPSLLAHTGANVIDYIDITCRNAAINNDTEEMDIAFNRLKDEITNDKVEGFQKDGSFFQHGRQVQNVSYGKCIIRIGKTLYNLKGTSYNLPDDKMTIISDYILKGIRDSTFKGYTNYTTVGREYCRPGNLDTQKNGFKELSYFLDLDYFPNDKKEQTANFISSLENRTNAVKEDTITYFPIAKMIVANIGHDENHEGIYISYKATEPNLCNTECVNGENCLGINLTFGTNTCVMDHGNEYYDIAPIMNYNLMPGTSAIFHTFGSGTLADQDEAIKEDIRSYGHTELDNKVPEASADNDYVYNDGQLDDITYSMTKTKHDDVTSYTVTCFTTKDGMVLVGSDISADTDYKANHGNTVKTTVDQYITNDDPSSEEENTQFLNHKDGNVIYKSLVNNQPLIRTIEKRTYTKEDWNRNNSQLDVSKLTGGEKNLVTITVKPNDFNNVKSYAYSIQPAISNKSFKLAYNAADDGIHAIELPNNKIAAAFYNKNKTSFDYEGKTYKLSKDFILGKGAFEIFDKQ